MKLIDRDKLIEEIKKDKNINIIGKIMINRIIKQPVINQWISCKERLPKENEDVLIYTYRGEVVIANLNKDLGENLYFEESFDRTYTWELKDVIAWQPLPAPYEEKENVD